MHSFWRCIQAGILQNLLEIIKDNHIEMILAFDGLLSLSLPFSLSLRSWKPRESSVGHSDLFFFRFLFLYFLFLGFIF